MVKLPSLPFPLAYLLSHGVGSSLEALVGRSAEVAVPRKVEHGGAEADEGLRNGGRQLSSVVVAWRHCTDIFRRVECANPLAETHRRDRCTTAGLLTIDVNKPPLSYLGGLSLHTIMGPSSRASTPTGGPGYQSQKVNSHMSVASSIVCLAEFNVQSCFKNELAMLYRYSCTTS